MAKSIRFDSSLSEVARFVSPCGSLNCGVVRAWMDNDRPAEIWRALLDAAEVGTWDDLVMASQALVETAVPEEGEIHPQRARVEIITEGRGHPVFLTPGGVSVAIRSNGRGGLVADIDFGRDSVTLASEMLATVALRDPRREVICDNIRLPAGVALAHLLLRASVGEKEYDVSEDSFR